MSRFDLESDEKLFSIAYAALRVKKDLKSLSPELLWCLSERISNARYELLCFENSKEVFNEKKINIEEKV